MPIVTKPNTFTANQIIDANQMNQNFDSIYGLVNGSLDAANLAANAINDSTKMANEVVIPSKSKGLIYATDLFGQNWVVAGGLATFSGSPANQIQVNTVSANILQVDGTYRHVSVTGTSYTTSALSSTYYLDLQPDGTMSWATTHSAQAGYLPLATVTTNGSGNVLVVTDVRVLSAGIAWLNISKAGSSLADLTTRSATDLTSGSLPIARLPAYTGDVTSASGSGANVITPLVVTNSHISATAAIDATKLGAGTVNNTKLGFLSTVTSDVQAQLNAKTTIASGTGSPMGVVTPTAAGQLYLDQLAGLTYVSNGVTNTSWVVETQYYGMSIQAIINAAMEIWQQGTTFTNPSDNLYTADMWSAINFNSGVLPTTIVHSQATLTAGDLFGTKYAYNINVNGAGSGFGATDRYGEKQKIEFGTSKLCGNGKKVTISFLAKSNIAAKRIAVGLKQVYGTGGSPTATETLTPTISSIRTLTSTMSFYTFTFTTNTLTGKVFGTNNDDYLELRIYQMWGSSIATSDLGGGTAETFGGAGDVSFTEVVVNAGDVALPYQPKSFNDELQICQRYFEKSYGYPVAVGTASNGVGIESRVVPSNTIVMNQTYGKTLFKVIKRTTTPIITIYPFTTPSNTGAVSNANGADLAALSGSTALVGDTGFSAFNGTAGSITTVNLNIIFHWTADARL